MKLLWTLVALLLVLAAIAGAQGTITPAPAREGVISGRVDASATGTLVVGSSFDVGPGSMKGVPFSADVVTETNRQLADGNRIHRETHGKMFRDSEGRTRTENEIQIPTSQPHEHVLIFDPVEKVFISLDVRHKTRNRESFPASHSGAGSSASSCSGDGAAGTQTAGFQVGELGRQANRRI